MGSAHSDGRVHNDIEDVVSSSGKATDQFVDSVSVNPVEPIEPIESIQPLDAGSKNESSTSLASQKTTPVKGGCDRFLNEFSGFLFPKLTPIAWSTFFILTFYLMIPAVVYIIAFTKIGFGLDTFHYLSDNYEQYGVYLAGGIFVATFSLYLFDIYYWSSETGSFFRKLFVLLVSLATSILIIIMSGSYPFGPGCLFIVYTTIWLVFIQMTLYRDRPAKVFVSWLSGPLFFVAMLTLVVWIAWTLWNEENEWNTNLSIAEADESGCTPNFSEYPDCKGEYDGGVCFYVDEDDGTIVFEDGCDETCTNVYADCYNMFILWVGPFFVTLGLLFLSFFATFLRTDENISPEQETTKFVRIWVFLLFSMWVGASLAGVGSGVSTTLAALTLASFIAASIFLAISFSKIERKEKVDRITEQLKLKYGNFFDVFWGLLIVTCTPIFLIYFAISFVIQRIRDINPCNYNKPPDNTMSVRQIAGVGWLTVEARRLVREFLSWNRTRVFIYALYWGIAFMVLYVIVAQFTLLFLSWLIEETSEMSLGVVTGIMVGIGMTLFLLPPVPGVPIYLTLGLVIIPTGRDGLGIIGSIIYAMGVSLCLKLLACTLQQKLIGGLLQNKVTVRQFCMVNSDLMRSMKLVLSQPGLSIDKVSILIGGPDWPTSVLCGIMDLSLIPVLVGTLPIIFLITPTLLTGSFTYMSGLTLEDGELEFPWAGTLTTISAAITFVVQFGSMIVAAYYLEKTVSNRKADLEAIPIDEEVRIADERDEAIRASFEEIIVWDVLPLPAKLTLLFAVVMMIVCCYLVQFFHTSCFVEYQLTYTIDTHLNGDWRNLVKPLGHVANGLFLASVALLIVFRSWAMRRAVKQTQTKQLTSE